MIAAILAGGMGTRLQEYTAVIPKPMVEIGARPILWHIMKSYSSFGVRDFCVALGYKGHVIKKFFADYPMLMSNLHVDLARGSITMPEGNVEDWVIDLVDTGAQAQTGARVAKLKRYLDKEPFFLTYGDGVADVDLNKLLECHRRSGKAMTLTAVQPPARFGALDIKDGAVEQFMEKPHGEGGWINGGFFVCEPRVFDYVTEEDGCIFEHEPMERLARDGELAAYQHSGFWHSMDTVRDVEALNHLWQAGNPPWRSWVG